MKMAYQHQYGISYPANRKDIIMTETTTPPTVVEPVDDKLVEQAYQKLFEIFSKVEGVLGTAIEDCGKYLLKTFYDDEIELARKKKSPKDESLNQLIKRFPSGSSTSPSKSWIYNSIGLIIQEKDIEKFGSEIFHTYGKLLLSHKTHLLSVKDMTDKVDLITKIVDNNLPVSALDQLKKELITRTPKSKSLLSLLNSPDKLFDDQNKSFISQTLEGLSVKKRDKIKSKALEKAQDLEKEIESLTQKIKLQKGFIKKYQELSNTVDTMMGKES